MGQKNISGDLNVNGAIKHNGTEISYSGMSNPMTTQGDLIVGGTSGTPTRLAKGTTGQILKSTASGLEWANESSSTIPTVTIALSQVVSQTPLQIELTQAQYDIFAANKQVIIDVSALGETTVIWNFQIDNGSYICFGVTGADIYNINGSLFAINKTSLIGTATHVNFNNEIGFNAGGDIHISSERDLNIATSRNSNIYSLADTSITTEDGDITISAQTTDDPLTSSSPGKLTLNADNGVYLADSDNSSNKDKYLHSNATTGAVEWVSGSGGGSTVEANPVGTPSANLNSVDIEGTIYRVKQFNLTDTGYIEDISLQFSDTTSETIEGVLLIENNAIYLEVE